jgi:hypothetical protein
MMNSHSEVAQLRIQIEAECQAIQHLMLFSSSASHCVISTKYRNLERYHDRLKPLLGECQATSLIVDTYDRIVK